MIHTMIDELNYNIFKLLITMKHIKNSFDDEKFNKDLDHLVGPIIDQIATNANDLHTCVIALEEDGPTNEEHQDQILSIILGLVEKHSDMFDSTEEIEEFVNSAIDIFNLNIEFNVEAVNIDSLNEHEREDVHRYFDEIENELIAEYGDDVKIKTPFSEQERKERKKRINQLKEIENQF